MFNSIRKKILIANGILLLTLLLVLLLALSLLNRNQKFLEKEEQAMLNLSEIGQVKDQFMSFRTSSVEFLILLQNRSKKSRNSSFKLLHSRLKSSPDPQLKLLAEELENYYQQLLTASTAFINDDRIQGTLLLNGSARLAGKILQALDNQYSTQDQLAKTLVQSVHESNQHLSYAVYLLLAMMLIIGTAISVFIADHISRQLVSLQQAVSKIEISGDLTHNANINSKDEVGILAAAFNRLISNLATIVREVKGRSSQLACAAEQLSGVTTETSHGALQQSGAITQVATAMNQMEATVREIATNAERASASANKGSQQVSEGNEVVQSTISAIRDLANDVERSSSVILQLKDESERIGTVLDVINSIAEQTNLLALNAAIEAARAGEHGRGFAVVADEVRVLAQRTQTSTREIEASISSLQNGTQHAVNAMNTSRSKADNTVQLAQAAGNSLALINEAITDISMLNTQIATAAEQQHVTSEEINRNINDIQSIADKTSSGAEQTASASAELSKSGEQLQILVEQFKV